MALIAVSSWRPCHGQADDGEGIDYRSRRYRKMVDNRILMDALSLMTQLGVILAEKVAT